MEGFSLTSNPIVYSEDPNERKKMRRTRIKRRLMEAQRKKTGDDGLDLPEINQTAIDGAIEISRDALRRLYYEGKEQVSNILMARDQIEMERRKQEEEVSEMRIKKLRSDSVEAQLKLDLISEKWEELQQTKDPLEMYQHMNEQKKQCLELIAEKNKVIKAFQEDLRIADEKYMKNKKEMCRELGLLTKRIDEQTLAMKKAYRAEQERVEESIEKTMADVEAKQTEIWETLNYQRERIDVFNMDKQINMAYEFQENLQQIHTEDEEKQRETRIQLELDIQTLELELEQIKALCLLNSEKLDYNYQVLKQREEENVYIKNHQKRRLNKLQDIINTMKKKFESKKEASAEELKNLLKEITRYHNCVLETERKAEHFSKLNDEKFNQVWDMKDEEAMDMVEKIRIADKIIYEQIIGRLWKPPTVLSLNKTDMPSYKTAVMLGATGLKTVVSDSVLQVTKDFKDDDRSAEVVEGHHRLLHHILELISDQAGFLMDQKLNFLLLPHTKTEKEFVRLDRVFTAIGVQKEKDIETLKKSFYPYVFCLVCDKKEIDSNWERKPESESLKQKHSSKFSPTTERSGDHQEKETKSSGKSDTEDTDEDDNMTEDLTLSGSYKDNIGDTDNLSPEKSIKTKEQPEVQVGKTCNITHPLIIEKHNVLKGLKDFVINFHSDKCRLITGLESKIGKKRYTISRLLAKDDIVTHWGKYMDLLPGKIEMVWNIVFLALEKYLKLLRERHRVNVKAQALRKQNQELKKLLSLNKIDKYRQLTLPGIPPVVDKPTDLDEISKIINKLAL